jgi:exopolysaccharide production protein ExoQ
MTYLVNTPDRSLAISPIEKAFTLAALFFYTGALACFIGDDNPLRPVRELFAYAGFAITLGLLLINVRVWLPIALRDLLLWLFVGLTLASVLWSDVPGDTVNNLIPVVRVTTFGLYFGTRYSLREQVQMVAWIFGIGAIASVLVAIALPYYGIMGYGLITNSQQIVHQGIWRGAYIHRNILSAMMAIGFLASLFCMVRLPQFRWVGWIFIGLSSFLIIISQAKSAPTMLLVVLLLIPFYKAMRWSDHVAIPFFVIMALIVGSAAIFMALNFEEILNAIGRDITLTGRTDYWRLIISKALDRRWLGYGYNAFWIGDWKGEVADVWRFLQDGDEPPHPHNGFLYTWLNVGFIGLGIFVAHWCRTFWRSIRWLQSVPIAEGLVPIAYLTLFLLMNITETMLMQPDIIWLLYVSTSLALVADELPVALPQMEAQR